MIYNLATHLDQVATADLVECRGEERPKCAAPKPLFPEQQCQCHRLCLYLSGGCPQHLFRPAHLVLGQRPLVLGQELRPLFRGPRRCLCTWGPHHDTHPVPQGHACLYLAAEHHMQAGIHTVA